MESNNNMTQHHVHSDNNGTLWSGMETDGMMEAKCSLLLQEEADYDARIKALPKQRVIVYQDKGLNLHQNPASSTSPNSVSDAEVSDTNTSQFTVEFSGATILQLEPVIGGIPQSTMPVTMTVGGRCVFTPENYQDFRVMMRTKQQSQLMDISPNGSFDWPDVSSLLLCPVCGQQGATPRVGDRKDHEYWMVFYPLLQITVMKGSHMTLGTRTICRLTCLDCMEDLLEGLTLQIQPGNANDDGSPSSSTSERRRRPRLCFTLPASDVLAEAGSASFLEDGPPRPETHPHVDDILDAWTLYNLWEHSGAWEALQNDYRMVLSRSMHADPAEQQAAANEPRLKERMGRPCGNAACNKVHGLVDSTTGDMTRLVIRCRECNSEYYCSKDCRSASLEDHHQQCLETQQDREERREKRAKKVQCDTCQKHFPYTKMKKCSRCRKATYCSVDCQRLDWQRHRDVCC